VLRRVAPALLIALVACGSGGGSSASKSTSTTAETSTSQEGAHIDLTSSAFRDGGAIPVQYTCDGAGQSPPLAWTSVPPGTASLALRVQDIDTPQKFVHWLIYDIKGSTTSLAAGEVPPGAKQTNNSFGKPGYGGPCPPAGSKHRYVFTLLAMQTELTVSDTVSATDLWDTLERSAVTGKGELTGTYQRTHTTTS
jgi:Raf kinase inhibitor-like YbhB/YbcL family protein